MELLKQVSLAQQEHSTSTPVIGDEGIH